MGRKKKKSGNNKSSKKSLVKRSQELKQWKSFKVQEEKKQEKAITLAKYRQRLKDAKIELRLSYLCHLRDWTKTKAKKKGEGNNSTSAIEKTGPWKRLLCVGEGDFSFASSIANLRAQDVITNGNCDPNCKEPSLVIATGFDRKSEVMKKYPNAEHNLVNLKKHKVKCIHGVDATNLHENEKVLSAIDSINSKLRRYFNRTIFDGFSGHSHAKVEQEGEDIEEKLKVDIILWNFPHSGSGEKDKEKSREEHETLLSKFVNSAVHYLDPKGEIHITLKIGKPYDDWNISKIATENDLIIYRKSPFIPQLFQGYQHRRTVGAALVKPEYGGPKPNDDITKGDGANTWVLKFKQSAIA